MSEMLISNLSDGDEVAGAIGMYVNSFCTPGKAFYKNMLTRDKKVQHNFTMLCLEWLKRLSEITCYDDRNAASRSLAIEIVADLNCDDLSRQKTSGKPKEKSMVFDCRNDENAAELFEYYLSVSKDNGSFISKMLKDHRTNQQSFTRMCVFWFKALSDLTTGKSRYLLLAKKANSHYRYLPMI